MAGPRLFFAASVNRITVNAVTDHLHGYWDTPADSKEDG